MTGRNELMTSAARGEARPMPSLRAGLHAGQRECAAQLVLCLVRHLMGVFPVPPESEWLIMPNREVPGRVPFRSTGRPRRIA
jgi:hypothetical protein